MPLPTGIGIGESSTEMWPARHSFVSSCFRWACWPCW